MCCLIRSHEPSELALGRVPSSPPLLIVDDDAISRRVLRQCLDKAGFASHTVGSGSEAISWLAENQPSLVLLDLVMPPPDGYTVLRTIRETQATREVPVVVLTALDAEEEVSRAFEMGADDFVRKPFKTAELVARIRSQLRLRQYVDALGRRERDARVVLELTQSLSSTLDFRDILYTVVRRIAEVARVDRCSIVLVRDEGKVGYVVAASDDKKLRDLPIDLGKYPEIRRVLETGEPLIIDDAATDPMLDVVRSELPKAAFASAVCIPILYEDRPLGVLFLRSLTQQKLQQQELWVARTVASATAIALRNARMMQSLREQTRESTYARFEAERRIRALEPYADFFHASADGIVVVDRRGIVLFSNPRARELLGVDSFDLGHASFFDWLVPEDRDRLSAQLSALFEEDSAPSSKNRRTTDLEVMSGGRRRTIAVSIAAMTPDDQEEDDAALLTFRDVTNERSTERELTKTKEFLERVIDSSVDAIISADMRGNVLLFNRAAERVFDYPAHDVIGKINVRDLYPEGLARDLMKRIRGEAHGGAGRLEQLETTILARGNVQVPVLVSAALIVDQGAPVGSVGVMTDLRDRIRMQASLDAAEQELRSREKESLVAELAGAAAHELNQPLTSVLGYAEIIRRRAKDNLPHNREIEALAQEAERMADIVRKIGKITRYETKTYVGDAKILDLDRSVPSDDADPSGTMR
ncbi:MAG: PAS domain S-box protein [Polyangiaceae bacterium]|nr:PAS domain S-box protein [Polyangiaceae bacterium]MBK8937796.1 PAS domain S-box protein [Polyangiaceae bacterium]